jgi:cytochrome c-type biogenesis protein CcmH/NrfG
VAFLGGEAKADALYTPYIQRIEQQLQKKPRDARLLTVLGRLYAKVGRSQDAEAAYQRALKAKPHYSHALLGLARLALQKKQIKQAALLARQVLRRVPRHASAWAILAETERLKSLQSDGKKKKKAIQRGLAAWEKAVRYAPRAPQHHFHYALVLLGLGKIPDAHLRFLQASTLRPEHPCYALGVALSKRMMLGQTKQLYPPLLRWYPQCSHPLLRSAARPVLVTSMLEEAQRFHQQNQWLQALSQTRALIRLEPLAYRGYMFLAMLLLERKQCQEATEVLRKLLTLQPAYLPAQRLLLRIPSHCLPPKRNASGQSQYPVKPRVSP